MSTTITETVTVENSVLLSAYRGVRSSQTPLWFMRQAGRYLPEYRDLRKQYSMLDLIRSPKLAAEVTLQPLRRFEFDGSIIFADILNPLIGMGMQLDFVEGSGPKIFNLIKTADDVAQLKVPSAEENIPYTLEAINIVATEIAKKGLPLLGFCGAPFTLATYMLADHPSDRIVSVLNFIKQYPDAWQSLQNKLSELVATHLLAQANAGAKAVQIFDTWVGHLSEQEFQNYVKPYLQKAINQFKASVTNIPLIYFGRATKHIFHELSQMNIDVLGVDYDTDLKEAASMLARPLPLQGNLSPDVLAGPKEHLEKNVLAVLESGSAAKSHIFNLGHGILPHTPIENVEYVLRLVKNHAL